MNWEKDFEEWLGIVRRILVIDDDEVAIVKNAYKAGRIKALEDALKLGSNFYIYKPDVLTELEELKNGKM